MKLEEANLVSLSLENRSRVITALSLLLVGQLVKVGEYDFALAETEDGGCQGIVKVNDENILGHHITLSEFVNSCVKMTEDEHLSLTMRKCATSI